MLENFKTLKLDKNLASFSSNIPNNPLYYVLFEACLYHKLPQQNHSNLNDFLLFKSYQDKILNLEEKYFILYNTEDLTQSIHCFFLPQAILPQDAKEALLDVLLPTYFLQRSVCVVFIGNHKNIFCFYQNQKLVFCKIINHPKEEIETSLNLLKSCYNFQTNEVYAINYQKSQEVLSLLQHHYHLIPLFALIDPAYQDFDLCASTPSFPLPYFQNFIPVQEKPTLSSIKNFSKLIAPCIIIPFLLWIILIGYEHYLRSRATSLQQNSSQAISIHLIEQLKEENKSLALILYPLIHSSPLKALDPILSLFSPYSIHSLSFQSPKTLAITLKTPAQLSPLLTQLNSLGYKTSIQQDEELSTTFIIEMGDD